MSYYWFCSGIRLSLDIDGTTIGSNKPFMEGGDNFSDSFYFPLFRIELMRLIMNLNLVIKIMLCMLSSDWEFTSIKMKHSQLIRRRKNKDTKNVFNSF